MFDLKVKELQDKVISLLNESGLPMSVIVLVLKDITRIAERDLEIVLKRQEEQLKQQTPPEVTITKNDAPEEEFVLA